MSNDEQRISDLIDGGIEQMKNLKTASNFATKAVNNLFSNLMKNKKELWEIVKIEFEKDLKEYEGTFICDIILMSEPDFINEEEMNFLLNEMSEYAEENGMEVGRPFWNCNDIDSRRNFINEKIKKYS